MDLVVHRVVIKLVSKKNIIGLYVCKSIDSVSHYVAPPLFQPQVLVVAILLMVIGLFLMLMGFPFFIVTMAFTGLLIGCK